MKKMRWLADFITKPVRENGLMFFIVWFCCVGIVVFGNLYLHYRHESVFVTSLCTMFDAYILSLLVYLIPHGRWKKMARGVIYVLLCGSLLIESFLIFNYGSFIRPFAVLLFVETNGRESAEFLSFIWTLPGTYYAVLLTSLLTLCAVALYSFVSKWFRACGRWWVIVLFLLIVWSATREAKNYVRFCRSLQYEQMRDLEFSDTSPNFYSSFTRIVEGFLYYHLLMGEYDLLDKTVAATEVEDCKFVSPVMVLIIGESYNKYHSPLYNPKSLNTTPRLCKLAEDSLLYVYKDVVSVSNRTSEVLRNIFSMDKQAGGDVRYTLFPAIFKKAGYDVKFITNQFAANFNMGKYDISGGAMFNFGDLSKNQFTDRNKNMYEFDMDLLRAYDAMEIKNNGPMLAIFHLLGQHAVYKSRYPESYAYFTKDSVDIPFGEEACRIVAEYGNATLYNDAVVDSIIARFADKEAVVIYLSDHGEQVYDGVDCWGRSYEMPLLRTTAKYQYEVPFFIYMSSLYKERHPKILEQVKRAQERPFLTNDLPHLLLYLAGISHKDYDERRNLLSPVYDAERKRLLQGTIDYDDLVRPNIHKSFEGDTACD